MKETKDLVFTIIKGLIIFLTQLFRPRPGTQESVGAIQPISGCRIKSGMTKYQDYSEAVNMPPAVN